MRQAGRRDAAFRAWRAARRWRPAGWRGIPARDATAPAAPPPHARAPGPRRVRACAGDRWREWRWWWREKSSRSLRGFPGGAKVGGARANMTTPERDGHRQTEAPLPQPLLQSRVQRIVPREHVVDIRDRHALGALVAQEARERVHMRGRAMQRQHAGRGRAAERRGDAEALLRLLQHLVG